MKISKQFLDAVLPKRMRGSQSDNEYTPKGIVCVQSTVEPDTSGFNETFNHIHKQLKQK
jgi:hypothetical protein